MDITKQIANLLNDTTNNMGCNIVKVSFVGNILQILIEKIDFTPVTIKDCETLSKSFSAILDVEDIIKTKYTLEVSSAGMDRPLFTIEDYKRFTGRKIKLELKETIENISIKKLKGIIEGVNNNIILIKELNNKSEIFKIDFNNILKAKLLIDDDFIKQILKTKKAERKK